MTRDGNVSLLLFLLSLAVVFHDGHAQTFTSIVKLQELPAVEKELITALRIYLGLTKLEPCAFRSNLEK